MGLEDKADLFPLLQMKYDFEDRAWSLRILWFK